MSATASPDRHQLTRWFRAALGDLDLAASLRPALQQLTAAADPGPDRAARPLDRASPAGGTLVIAFGKAARAMAEIAVQELSGRRLRGLVVPPEPDGAPLRPFEVLAGGHPLPTEGSFAAARRALELCRSAAPDEDVVFLLSGGGSSMLELPMDPAVTVAEARALHRALIGCGGTIDDINAVRKQLSAIKGGRLAMAAARARTLHSFAVSDVAPGRFATIASGPTCPDDHTSADCRARIARLGIAAAVPPALRERLELDSLPDAVPSDHPVFARSTHREVLGGAHAVAALRGRVAAAGLLVAIDQTTDDLPHEHAAEQLLADLRDLSSRNPDRPVAVLASGELSVPLPAAPGVGGRNQHFVLACAVRIADLPIAVLSCGTDGVDGNSNAAGAVADGTTCSRAQAIGLEPHDHLRRFDSGALFTALGDAVVTGPTGTNVRDLRLLVHA